MDAKPSLDTEECTKEAKSTDVQYAKRKMVTIKRIKPVRKGKHLMTHIALAKNQGELTRWRKANKHKYKVVFYGSPRKDLKGGAYALVSK